MYREGQIETVLDLLMCKALKNCSFKECRQVGSLVPM